MSLEAPSVAKGLVLGIPSLGLGCGDLPQHLAKRRCLGVSPWKQGLRQEARCILRIEETFAGETYKGEREGAEGRKRA